MFSTDVGKFRWPYSHPSLYGGNLLKTPIFHSVFTVHILIDTAVFTYVATGHI